MVALLLIYSVSHVSGIVARFAKRLYKYCKQVESIFGVLPQVLKNCQSVSLSLFCLIIKLQYFFQLELFSAWPCQVPSISVGWGWAAGYYRSSVSAVSVSRTLEWQRSDTEREAVWVNREPGKMLFFPQYDFAGVNTWTYNINSKKYCTTFHLHFIWFNRIFWNFDMVTVNFLNIRTPKIFVLITLKFELCCSTVELCVPTMQMEWQTV